FLVANRGIYMDLMGLPIQQAIAKTLELAVMGSGLMVLTLLIVILIDVPYQLWSHAKKLRMSKDEVKREHKESEGDPQIKARIRQQQQAMARGRMMSKVPEADVIITNPEHFAVALRYDGQAMAAPRLVAKGVDRVALRICELGDAHAIPRLQAPALARALYRYVDLDAEIPMALYTAVAEVMAWAFQLRRAKAAGETPPPTPHDLPIPEALQVPVTRPEAEARV
ncbi:MAG: EscU/YscU/HrcU family type III secretion system export apparatus switch protein, partial [Halochromatium sp.]